MTVDANVVCAWLGNSEIISRKHYIQVTDEDYTKAAPSPAVKAIRDGDKSQEKLANGRPDKLLRRSVDAAQKTAQSALVSSVYDGPQSGDEAEKSEISQHVIPSQLLSKVESSPGGIRTPDQGIMSPLL